MRLKSSAALPWTVELLLLSEVIAELKLQVVGVLKASVGELLPATRGGLVAAAGEAFTRRHSLCCGHRGCRKRGLPPSLRFLGRHRRVPGSDGGERDAQIVATAREAVAASGVSLRTLCRWGCW
jgi:hypothetical protein